MKPGLFRRVFAAFDYMVLTHEAGELELAAAPPPWFPILFLDADPDVSLRVPEESAFLHNFMEDARSLWSRAEYGRAESGPWVEVGEGGEEWSFEATALHDAEGDLLVVHQIRQKHEEARSVLQRAREFVLDNETLERIVDERTAIVRQREEEIALCLVSAAEWRDSDTGDHIRRIGDMAQAVARAMGSSKQLVTDMWLAAAMHDIGKIGIADEILLKPGPLTSAERKVMQEHSVIGKRVLDGSNAPLLRLAAEIAHYHHEHVNGQGYPEGLEGDAIPFGARIVAVVDVYDALMTDRVYRSAWPLADVLAYLESGRGSQFDADILDVFLDLRPTFQYER